MAAANLSLFEFLDAGADYFTVLGLAPAYDVDRDAVETAYLELSKRWHPDRFAGADSATRRRALESTSLLNEAYRTVKNRVRRAEYLCKLGGIDLDGSDEGGAPKMDRIFLMEMIERRERIEEMRRAGDDAVADFRETVEDEAVACLRAAASHLERGDVETAARALVVRRYLGRLLDEIDGNPHP